MASHETLSGGPMACPFCSHPHSAVKDSRPTEDGTAIRRRRLCIAESCGQRFTTHERVTLRELVVVKRSGRRQPFDRNKLERSVRAAIGKRPLDPALIAAAVGGVVRALESKGEVEISSSAIGEIVLTFLQALDDVAYVRYASVYRAFQTADDFANFLGAEALA